ncbi:MAG TPA: DMT family transporter [Xanthobacteraceae bacterium]|nr:DMT family transporter [Xanthobacteraceae bacterium]
MTVRTARRLRRILPDAGEPGARLAGIALMCVGFAVFALLDSTAKWLSPHVPAAELAWARYAGNFALVALVFNPWTHPGVLRTRRPFIQITRALLLVVSTVTNFIAVRYLQLDQTVSITFSTPFFVALFAGPLLGEWLGPRRWMAILFGFCGVLVVIRPTGELHPAMLYSLAGAFCYALYNISTRFLARTDSTATTMFYAAAIGLAVTTVPLPFVWTTPTGPWVIANLMVIGIYGAIGHLLLVLAHRRAPAAVLSPFIYTQLIWMTLAGWLVFGQFPTLWTLAGAGIVILSGLYLIHRERVDRATGAIQANIAE